MATYWLVGNISGVTDTLSTFLWSCRFCNGTAASVLMLRVSGLPQPEAWVLMLRSFGIYGPKVQRLPSPAQRAGE